MRAVILPQAALPCWAQPCNPCPLICDGAASSWSCRTTCAAAMPAVLQPGSSRGRNARLQGQQQVAAAAALQLQLAALSGVERLCEAGRVERALDAFLRMNQEGLVPSVQTLDSFLQACGKTKALSEAKQVHAIIIESGLESNRLLAESLISTLVRCGSLGDALEVFRRLQKPTVFSWTALISGYTKSGKGQEALGLYQQMLLNGVNPNTYTFVSVLKACGSLGDLEEGKQIHTQAIRDGCDFDLFVGTALVDMYSRCGSMEDAWRVFRSLPHHDVTLWTAMMSGYVQQDQGEKALQMYDQMHSAGARPDAWTFASILKACSSLAGKEETVLVEGQPVKQKSLSMGKVLHAEASRTGLDAGAFFMDSLLYMYAKCGSMVDARRVFGTLSQSNVVSWTAMIGGYAGQSEMVLEIYTGMQAAGVTPDPQILVSVLKECAKLAASEESTSVNSQPIKVKALQIGKEMHVEAVHRGYQPDLFLGNTLMHMYAACGSIQDARDIFDRLVEDDVVSWNVLIAAYANQETGERALQLYEQMQQAGTDPDIWTFVSVLKACCSLSGLEQSVVVDGLPVKPELLGMGRAMHAEVVRRGFKSDVFICNALVSMYSRCGSSLDAEVVFKNMAVRNVVSWSAMIAGYAQHEKGEKALKLYAQMQEEGIRPDEGAYLSILKACSAMGALDVCVHIHQSISDSGQNRWSCRMTTALLDAYSKCGSMFNAQKLFDALPKPDVVSCTALIAGYARQGDHLMSVDCFENMERVGIEPNGVTFVSVLHACSHAGMVDRGVRYFECMTKVYGITPTVEHYACMVDLYGRSGLMAEAADMIRHMPMRPNLAVWLSLLSACRKHGNIDLARRAFEQAILEYPTHWSAYLLMLNIYADYGKWAEVEEIEDLSMHAGLWKKEDG